MDHDPSHDRLLPQQIAIYRRMTPEQRLRVAGELYRSSRALSAAGLRMRHPDWNDAQVEREVRRIFLYAGS